MAISTAAAIIGSTIIGAGASLLAGGAQSKSAKKAAKLQAGATSESIEEIRRQYDLSRQDLAPYRLAGFNALAPYAALYGVGPEGALSKEEMQAARDRFMETPGYQFRFDEGLRALDRSASARGKLLGGGYGRELTRYGQGIASSEFTNYANRLAGLAGMGQGATSTTATLGAQASGNIANTLTSGARSQGSAIMAAGTARASGYAGSANAALGGINNYLFAQAMGMS